MMYTLDVSGHTSDGRAGVNRFGGLFRTIEDAVSYGLNAAKTGRLPFRPELLWVRDEEGEVMRRDKI